MGAFYTKKEKAQFRKERARLRRNAKIAYKKKSDRFLSSPEWKKVRMMVLKRDGARCVCCGATAADGRVMHVDHIKPRVRFPELALSMDNLQVLCSECNEGKGAWDETDWLSEYREREIGAKLRAIK